MANASSNAAVYVNDLWTLTQSYIAAHTASAQAFLNSFQNLDFSTPTNSITWNSIAPPSLPAVPDAPTLPDITVNLPATTPTALDEDIPVLSIDTFTEVAPNITYESPPALSYGTAPTVPEVSSVALPDVPVIDVISAPNYLSVSTPTFAGIDLHTDVLDLLTDVPTLSLVAPTALSYTPKTLNDIYTLTLANAIKTELSNRIANGGT
jgi:hypothetical protein